jgi:sporulation-control protein spo0M
MSFLDKMKAAAGMDSASLQVDIKERPSKRGDTLIAVARVVPGKNAQKLKYLRVYFEYEGKWDMKNADGGTLSVEGKCYIVRTDWQGSVDVMLQPGQTLEFPLQLKVPSDSPLTAGNAIKYKLFVRADIDDAKDPEFSAFFEITS